jgi:hypothetical protein
MELGGESREEAAGKRKERGAGEEVAEKSEHEEGAARMSGTRKEGQGI